MKYLKPIVLTEQLYRPIEDTINKIFEQVLYLPLMKAIAAAGVEINNAMPQGLEKAIMTGRIYIDGREVHGLFNASISRELKAMGATFDKRSSTWTLPEGAAIPARIQLALAKVEEYSTRAINDVIQTLDGIRVGDNVDVEKLKAQYGTAAFRLNEDFVAATKAAAIAPEFTPADLQIIAKDWANNLELYIQKWADDEITELRQTVLSNTARGQRAANLVKTIQDSYGVSKTKAKFLARQETSLLVSKMRELRYGSLGCKTYRWQGMNDGREREDHKVLNGSIHSWESPPITNRETGARNNPGEDFNCRCIAIPILPGEEGEAA